MNGRIVSINIAAEEGGAVTGVEEAELVPGRGIAGDRYWRVEPRGPKHELTLVEAEQIERFNAEHGLSIDPAQTRRNVVVRETPLNDLVGRDFTLGETRVRGIELCEPCAFMAGKLIEKHAVSTRDPKEIVAALAGRAGLRAQIIQGGIIRVGDPVRP